MSSELDDIMAAQADEAEEAFDLSDVEEVHVGALPAGEYHCICIKAKNGVVKNGENKGKPKFELQFQPVGSRKLIFKHAMLTGKGAGVTKSLLKTLGADVTKPVRASSLEGSDIWLTVTVREDRPGDNEIVSWREYDGEDDASEAEDLV